MTLQEIQLHNEVNRLLKQRTELKKLLLHETSEAILCLKSPANLEMLQNRLNNIYDAVSQISH